MNTRFLLLICFFYTAILSAQWKSLGSNNLPNEQGNAILGVHSPGEGVAWGFVWNIATFAPSQTFIKTTDGGATITTGEVTVEDNSLTPLGIFALNATTAWVGMVSEPCQCYGQVYKTEDGGSTWTKQFDTDSEQAMGGIYFWNENEGLVYGGNGTGNTSDQMQSFYTVDGGDTWIESTPADIGTGESMWLGTGSGYFAVAEDKVWIGTRAGRVFISEDKGITWSPSPIFAAGRTINAVAFSDTLNGVALSSLTSAGFMAANKSWVTSDGGTTWEEVAIPQSPNAFSIQHVPETPGTFVFSGGWNTDGIAVSVNSGRSWTQVSTPPLVSLHFTAPDQAFAGGQILDNNQGGLYKLTTSFDHRLSKVFTIAGTTTEGSATGFADQSSFYNPKNMTMDEDGNIYVADDYNSQIRKISSDGIVTVVAGVAKERGFLDGPADQALFNRPHGVAIDQEGNLLVTDFLNFVIRKITPDGMVETFAGTGIQGSDDGPAETASFSFISDIVMDQDGNIYVSDYSKIRKIDTNNEVTTLAGSDTQGFEDGFGGIAQFGFIWGIGIGPESNIYVSDFGNNAIRKVTPEGEVTTVAGNGIAGLLDGPADEALFNAPEDVAVDQMGNIYVADGQNLRVRKISPDGMVSTIAGSGSPSTFFLDDGQAALNGGSEFAQFGRLRGIYVKPDGNLLVSSWSNDAIREVQPGIPATALHVLEAKSDKTWRYTPIEHQDQFQLDATVQNTSMETASAVHMNITVRSAQGAIELQESSESIDIEALDQHTFSIENLLTVDEPGTYQVKFEFRSEDEGKFDTQFREIIVTDSLLSNNDQLPYYWVGLPNFNSIWYGKFGQQYNITQADTLTGFRSTLGATAGTEFFFEVFAIDGNAIDTLPIYRSEPISFEENSFGIDYYHVLPEPIVLPPGSYLFSNGVESITGYFNQGFDTDFQTTEAWVWVPELGENWISYHNFFGQPRICAPIVSPIFGETNIVTNTEELATTNFDLTIHPNPFIDQVNIRMTSHESTPQIFSLVDLQGKLLEQFELQPRQQRSFDFSKLPAGNYLINAKGSNWSKKIIKQ